jgi:hypothetical protein
MAAKTGGKEGTAVERPLDLFESLSCHARVRCRVATRRRRKITLGSVRGMISFAVAAGENVSPLTGLVFDTMVI